MKQTTLAAALAIAISSAQEIQYAVNFDLVIAEEDNLMNPLWMWRTMEGPKVQVDGFKQMTIPNNQKAFMKKAPIDGSQYAYMPFLKGGAVEYKVDLSNTDCGCVAGAYAMSISGGCDPEASMSTKPQCPSIDIMQANKYGFEMAVHSCEGGNCDAKSQCQYDMNKDGVKKYGKGAYGPNGTLIDTTRPFGVQTQFVADTKLEKVWKIKTLLRQGDTSGDQKEIIMEADCSDYLDSIQENMVGDMAFVFSSWDSKAANEPIDFECEHCDTVQVECANSSNIISNLKVYQSGFTEDKKPDLLQFQADSDFYGKNFPFYLNGLKGQELETQDRMIQIGKNNRAFVLDSNQNDDYWAYYHQYIGGSVQFDVNVSQVDCDSVIGVYLTPLDDETCSWDIKKAGVKPACKSIDLMESNLYGFAQGIDRKCRNRIFESYDNEGKMIYGMSSSAVIDTMNTYNVKIQFMSDKYQGDLTQIRTTLTQDGKTHEFNLDCGDKFDAFKDTLSGQMALAISNYNAGLDNEVSGPCPDFNHDKPKSIISNLIWTENDSIAPY